MEKILLINPGQSYYNKTFRASDAGSVGLPLGLLYIAAVLEAKGCEVKLLDCLVSDHTQFKRGHGYIFYGIPEERFKHEIRMYNPQIVGITSQFMAQEENLLAAVRLVKEVDDSIVVIAGGANISCRGQHLVANAPIDIAVKGEGEKIIDEIIDYFRGEKSLDQIVGVIFRKGGEIFESEKAAFIENLDCLSLPAYHLVEMERYLNLYKKGIYVRDRDVKRNISMITSRGCPYGCIFCSIAQSMGKKWRFNSAEYVNRHIKMLAEKYKVKHIHFEDDNLLLDIKRFTPILDTLAREKITWDTPNGIRVDPAITEDILRKMKQSGCKSLTIGVESGDSYVLNTIIKKNIKLDDVVEFARRCKKVGLSLRAFFVLGFPGETLKTMRTTIKFALELLKKYNVEIINMIATPLYGTELYKICSDNNYFAKEITPRAASESTVSDGWCLINTASFDTQDVEHLSKELTARAYRISLLRSIFHPFISLRRIGNIYMLKRTLKRMFFWK